MAAGQLKLTVEAGEGNAPILKVHGKDGEVPIALTARQAGELGRALLAASAVAHVGAIQAPGTPIQDCRLPVRKWGTGHSKLDGMPVVVLEIPGEIQLTFQFDRELAAGCAQALLATATG